MAKLTKLSIGSVVASIGGRAWRKLSVTSINTTAILGKAILGCAVLGRTDFKKLSTPIIYLETTDPEVPAIEKLDTPSIYIESDEPDVPAIEKLSTPIIYIESDEPETPDEPIVEKLATPTIYLESDEPVVKKLATPIIYLEIYKEPFTFTVGDATYSAEEGMTWYEWAGSDYSPDSCNCYSTEGNVYWTGYEYIVDSEGNAVIGSTPITEGGVYSIEEVVKKLDTPSIYIANE